MKYSILIIISLILVSCSTNQVTYTDLLPLKQGMSTLEADSLLDREFEQYDINAGGTRMGVAQYLMVTGVEIEKSRYGIAGGRTRTRTTTTSYAGSFYLIFKENKLYTWGFLYEFLRGDDPVLHQVADGIIDRNKQLAKENEE